MGTAEFDPIAADRRVWNAGRKVGAKRALKPRQVWAIRGGTLGDYVFPSRIDRTGHLSTRQYARLVDEWVVGVGLRREEYGAQNSGTPLTG